MKNGSAVAAFEQIFAEMVGAQYAIALCNGTATLHTALAACGLHGANVAVPPLTMSATSLAVVHAGGTPHYWDVDPDTFVWNDAMYRQIDDDFLIPVSLYGLANPYRGIFKHDLLIDDAAQTLRPHSPQAAFTSFSFQASKILALGEGGMLVTNHKDLAKDARQFSSLGYRMDATQPRIDPDSIKQPDTLRHHRPGWNYRMSDYVAEAGIAKMKMGGLGYARAMRHESAGLYRDAIQECDWIKPQHVPEGWTHDYWCYPVAVRTPALRRRLMTELHAFGAEAPYSAWAVSYKEPALQQYGFVDGGRQNETHRDHDRPCPVAEDLQQRMVQFQTNELYSAQLNAKALALAIDKIGRQL